jgi:hypothetical protein
MVLTITWHAIIRLAIRRRSSRLQVHRQPQGGLTLEDLEGRLCPSGGYLVVGSFNNNSVLRYDEHTGAFVDQFDPHNLANLKTPTGGVFGPDHNLYVTSGVFAGNNQSILQYEGASGVFQRALASPNITSPRGVLFGPDGNLYVANGNSAADDDPASVERFDGKTGAFLNYFVAPNSGGIEHPSYMVFGPDGKKDGKLDLYVANAHEGAILRYDGTTGASKGVFVSAASGGLDAPQGIVFGPDGNLYVASGNWFNGSNGPFYNGDFPPGAVLRFQGPSGRNPGSFLGTFIPAGSGGLANPAGLLFGPDPSGNGKTDLYVANSVQSGNGGPLIAEPGTSDVLRYDATTGAFLGVFVTPGSGGLKFPTFITFTETNPTTLNYNPSGQATSFDQTLAPVPTQPVGATNLAAPPPASAAPLVVSTTGALVPISNPDPLATCPPTGFVSPNAATEPYVVVNPTNSKNIVTAWIAHGHAGNAVSTSFDGGNTWQIVVIPGITECTGGIYPQAANNWLSFAPNGDLYSIGGAFGKLTPLMLVNKSTDGGLTWSNPIQLNTTGNSAHSDDKPSITADPSNPNYVYATWARLNPSFGPANRMETMFARSTDGGMTWQPEQSIHKASSGDLCYGQQIVVLPDGTLIDAFTEGKFTKNHKAMLTLLRSTDQGQTWSVPIAAAVQQPLVDPNLTPANALVTDPDTGQGIETHPMFPSVAVDRTSGNLYAAWQDARFGNFQYNSIAFSMSADGGFTWSNPIQVNQTPDSVPPIDRQAWNPAVAVAANGTVAVSYYDFRYNTAAPGASTDYWLAYTPAPATNPRIWSEVRLTDSSFNLEQAPTRFNGGFFLGDYEGLAAAGNDFVAVWGMPDGSAAAQESIFFRRVFSTARNSALAVELPISTLGTTTLLLNSVSPFVAIDVDPVHDEAFLPTPLPTHSVLADAPGSAAKVMKGSFRLASMCDQSMTRFGDKGLIDQMFADLDSLLALPGE